MYLLARVWRISVSASVSTSARQWYEWNATVKAICCMRLIYTSHDVIIDSGVRLSNAMFSLFIYLFVVGFFVSFFSL